MSKKITKKATDRTKDLLTLINVNLQQLPDLHLPSQDDFTDSGSSEAFQPLLNALGTDELAVKDAEDATIEAASKGDVAGARDGVRLLSDANSRNYTAYGDACYLMGVAAAVRGTKTAHAILAGDVDAALRGVLAHVESERGK